MFPNGILFIFSVLICVAQSKDKFSINLLRLPSDKLSTKTKELLMQNCKSFSSLVILV